MHNIVMYSVDRQKLNFCFKFLTVQWVLLIDKYIRRLTGTNTIWQNGYGGQYI